MDNLYQANIGKIRELQPGVQWAAEQKLNDCWGLNLIYRILEAFRTADRQNILYKQGRETPGDIVTFDDGYIKLSEHQKRLAYDIAPINCTYDDIAEVGSRYGITHPFPSYPGATFIDQPHFQFNQVAMKPLPQNTTSTPLHLSWEAEKERFWRGVQRLPSGLAKERALKRYQKLYGIRI